MFGYIRIGMRVPQYRSEYSEETTLYTPDAAISVTIVPNPVIYMLLTDGIINNYLSSSARNKQRAVGSVYT